MADFAGIRSSPGRSVWGVVLKSTRDRPRAPRASRAPFPGISPAPWHHVQVAKQAVSRLSSLGLLVVHCRVDQRALDIFVVQQAPELAQHDVVAVALPSAAVSQSMRGEAAGDAGFLPVVVDDLPDSVAVERPPVLRQEEWGVARGGPEALRQMPGNDPGRLAVEVIGELAPTLPMTVNRGGFAARSRSSGVTRQASDARHIELYISDIIT